MIYDVGRLGARDGAEDHFIIDPADPTRRKHIPAGARHEDLLVPIFRRGELVYDIPTLPAVRSQVQDQLAGLHPGIRRQLHPHEYPVGLERRLHELKTRMILELRSRKDAVSM